MYTWYIRIMRVTRKASTKKKKTRNKFRQNLHERVGDKMVIRFTLRPVGVYHFYCRYIFFAAYRETRRARPRTKGAASPAFRTTLHTVSFRKFADGSLSSVDPSPFLPGARPRHS